MKREIPFDESMIEILDRNNNVERIVGLIHIRAHSLGDEMLIILVKRLVDLLDGKEAMHQELHEVYGDLWDCFHQATQGVIERDEFIKKACKFCDGDEN